MRIPCFSTLAALALFAARVAVADVDTAASAGTVGPSLFHEAPSDATANAPLVLSAALRGGWETSDVRLHFRGGPEDPWREAPFRRSVEGDYRAEVPASWVSYPGVEYYIASRLVDGREVLHFASPSAPHRVAVLRDSDDQRYLRRLLQHGGRLHSVTVESSAVWFGDRSATFGSGGEAVTRRFHDHYWHVETRYTYRFLGPLYSITFGAGVLRGEGEEYGWRAPGSGVDSPGIDYGIAGVRLAALDWLSFEIFGRLGADEEGFSGGLGGLVTVGLPAGTHLDLGGEWTQHVGFRAFLEFAWDTVPYCIMSLKSEITDWPDTTRVGSVSSFNTRIRVHPLVELLASFGFAARHATSDAGVTGSLGVGLLF